MTKSVCMVAMKSDPGKGFKAVMDISSSPNTTNVCINMPTALIHRE